MTNQSRGAAPGDTPKPTTKIRFATFTWPDSGPKEKLVRSTPQRRVSTGSYKAKSNTCVYIVHALFQAVRTTSLWEKGAIAQLTLSNIFFFISFLTTKWGRLCVLEAYAIAPGAYTPRVGEHWDFVLWQCCRDDGFCLGIGWNEHYAAARASAILALLGHLVTLSWLIGHTLEKMVKYDICAFACIISFSWVTGMFVLASVLCFGVLWPPDVELLMKGTDVTLTSSFILACLCVPLLFGAGVCILIHTITVKKSLRKESKDEWKTADQLLGEDT